jgi:hypothetical protein
MGLGSNRKEYCPLLNLDDSGIQVSSCEWDRVIAAPSCYGDSGVISCQLAFLNGNNSRRSNGG